jgi:hypothetical protein
MNRGRVVQVLCATIPVAKVRLYCTDRLADKWSAGGVRHVLFSDDELCGERGDWGRWVRPVDADAASARAAVWDAR